MSFFRLLFLPVQFEQHHHFQVLLSQLGEVLGLKGTSKSSSDSFWSLDFLFANRFLQIDKGENMFGAHFIKVVFRIQPRIQGRLPYMGGFAIFQFTEVAIHSRGLAKFGAYCLFCLLHTLFLWRIARLAVLFECFSCLDVEGCFFF